MGAENIKAKVELLTVSVVLKAHHLGMTVVSFLARTDRLLRQVEKVKRNGKPTT
jgi:hypothetical protein